MNFIQIINQRVKIIDDLYLDKQSQSKINRGTSSRLKIIDLSKKSQLKNKRLRYRQLNIGKIVKKEKKENKGKERDRERQREGEGEKRERKRKKRRERAFLLIQYRKNLPNNG